MLRVTYLTTKNRPAHFRTGRQSFFLYFFVFHNRLHLIAVHEKPADPSHSQSAHNIQDRVLFQEHGGGNDEYSQYPGAPAHQSVLPERTTLPDGRAAHHGIEHMKARHHIRGCVDLIEMLDQLRADIVTGKGVRP